MDAIVTLLGELNKPYPAPGKTRANSTQIQINQMSKMVEPIISAAFDKGHFFSEPLQEWGRTMKKFGENQMDACI